MKNIISNKNHILYIIFLLNIFINTTSHSQEIKDTINTNQIIYLDDVQVVGYLQPQIMWKTPVSVSLLNKREIEIQSVTSMIPVMNTVPGVRMEERSPGSYRLSIRGSLTRSPYGVRNIKIYYNDFALTDAGGNTYLNALNINDIDGIEILKGPDGSLFGANSGGVVFLKSNSDTLSKTGINIYGGSFGLAGESVNFSKKTKKHYISFKQSFQRSDGYRQNTKNRRLFLQLSDVWQYNSKGKLEIYGFYSDLAYRTPGGLTLAQYEENPRQSRPATVTQPGSADQKSGVQSKMYFSGIRNKYQILPFIKHTISLWITKVDFINSFITNYETRDESNIGLRTYFSIINEKNENMIFKPSLDIGFEGQRMISDIFNYDNHAGEPGNVQAYNNIVNYQYFGFVRGRIELKNRFVVQTAVSLNFNGYHFRDTTNIKNNFNPVWMPHIALNYTMNNFISLRLTLSKGYSTPTTAEIRPVDNKIYTDLQPEQGWNTELGIRIKSKNESFIMDASCFHYLLQDGIISQMDSLGNTYFINSGRIRQIGAEFTSSWTLLPLNKNNLIFKRIQWNSSYTFSYFYYDKYLTNDNDFTGNNVAGVPRHIFINSLQFGLPWSIDLFVQHNFTSRIPLNDANSAYADNYNLLSAKITYNHEGRIYIPYKIYFAIDNLLNEKYSLGNDINAFGGRYYNAAPTINFQIGFIWQL